MSAAKRKSAPKSAPNSSARTISGGVSDIPLAQWKKHGDIITDSLWILGNRDKTGGHDGSYHGNFIPQIPHQLIRRFTRKGGVVLDAFLGSGTTMIESVRLNRHCIGIELKKDLMRPVQRAVQKIVPAKGAPFTEIINGDSCDEEAGDWVAETLKAHQRKELNFVILHPPYHDIIKFSANKKDLSNAPSAETFIDRFCAAVQNFTPLLADKHYLAVVIGDKYTDSQWVPLGFRVMDGVLKSNEELILKSVIIKNMVNNRAKKNSESLWRYRAFGGGFYIFRHEYILLFQKQNKKKKRGAKK